MRTRGVGASWWQVLGLVVLCAAAAALCVLAFSRTAPSLTDQALDDTAPSSSAGDADDGDTSASADLEMPKVKDQRRVDFTRGDDLPDGAKIIDSDGNEAGLEVTLEGLSHGPASEGAEGRGFVEVKLKDDVRKVGFRVRFAAGVPDAGSGRAVFVARQASYTDAVGGDKKQPVFGYRLEAFPTGWVLSAADVVGEEGQQLAAGSYPATDGPVSFEVVRDGLDLYVLDPTGAVSVVEFPGVEGPIGLWASWGLIEENAQQSPAVIESVWAG
ncbi:hypothetical protein [Nocardioides sp.]|uniref:hypothetical protein n=1 Tax=Nocardioides sp. TaxID=35761 RepID=UPI003567D1B0